MGPTLEGVQFQPVTTASERVGEYHVATGLDVFPVYGLDAIRVIDVPELRRIASRQSGGEELGAHGPVEDETPIRCD